MAVYYLDTSALVKRYVQEVGTAWVLNLTDPSAGHATGLQPLAFITADGALNNVAKSVGLTADNPNEHK